MSHSYSGIASWSFKLESEIHSYEDCRNFLDGWLDRRLGPHMRVTVAPHERYLAVVLYGTEIIRYYPDGTFSVDNGGYNTLTTKYRLDAVLPRGWTSFHRQKKLGLIHCHEEDWTTEEWPLDHERRLIP